MNVAVITRTDTRDVVAVFKVGASYNPIEAHGHVAHKLGIDRKLLHSQLVNAATLPLKEETLDKLDEDLISEVLARDECDPRYVGESRTCGLKATHEELVSLFGEPEVLTDEERKDTDGKITHWWPLWVCEAPVDIDDVEDEEPDEYDDVYGRIVIRNYIKDYVKTTNWSVSATDMPDVDATKLLREIFGNRITS